MTETKRVRGRPKGSKNKAGLHTAVEVPPIEEVLRSTVAVSPGDGGGEAALELVGNGRDEVAVPLAGLSQYERDVHDDIRRQQSGAAPFLPPQFAPGPQLAKLFVAAVENGYIIRPGIGGAIDERSWVVGSREDLARMVSWLVVERGEASPIGLQTDETV